MAGARRKVSAPLNEFHAEIDRLLQFDAANQANFSTNGTLSKRQLQILTESIFFTAFRAYENFIRDVFLLYCQEKTPPSGIRIKSYLKPINFAHAEQLIKSSMRFLDRNNPEDLINRAELYLKDGYPIKIPYSANIEILRDMKFVRNHIAHNSEESLMKYKNVLKKHFGVVPLNIPQPGDFLLLQHRTKTTKYYLVVYLEFFRQLSIDLT